MLEIHKANVPKCEVIKSKPYNLAIYIIQLTILKTMDAKSLRVETQILAEKEDETLLISMMYLEIYIQRVSTSHQKACCIFCHMFVCPQHDHCSGVNVIPRQKGGKTRYFIVSTLKNVWKVLMYNFFCSLSKYMFFL